VLLIRHGHTDAVGRTLVGRMPGVSLSPAGRREAERLASLLSGYPLQAIYTSALQRARETALPAARRLRVPLHEHDGLMEVNFGEWTGRDFAELEQLAGWRHYNAQRASAPVPGGECAAEVQRRILSTLESLARRHPDQTIAAVTHAELIRAAVLYYRGLSLDRFSECGIDPASITAVSIGSMSRLLFVNATSCGPEPADTPPGWSGSIPDEPAGMFLDIQRIE
jgi:broad specificity phosphatase PhoE